MPDRVIWGTYQDGYSTDIDVGFTANPFEGQWISGYNGEYETYPVAVPIEQFIKWYWRVRKWTVALVQAEDSTGLITQVLTRERDLALEPFTHRWEISLDDMDGPNQPAALKIGGDADAAGTPGPFTPYHRGFIRSENGFFPAIHIVVNFEEPGSALGFFTSSEGAFPIYAGFLTSGISFNLDGLTIPGWYYSSLSSTFIGNVANITPGGAAQSYWPYTGLVAPYIYDADSGAQLADPLTG